jgi:hypothetical protein
MAPRAADRASNAFTRLSAFNAPENSASLTCNEAAAIAGVACHTLERLIAVGERPAIVELSPRRRGVLASDLQDWLQRRRRSPGEARAPPPK